MPSLADKADRLAKVIARSGHASRREAERLVEAGHVTVNGEVIHHPAHPVVPDKDDVRIDGKALPREAPKLYVLFFKPKGTIVGRDDPDGRPSALELLGEVGKKVAPVGRLDFDTEGALLLTNDGDLKNKLTHPSSKAPQRYRAKVWRTPSEKTLERIRRGVVLEEGRTAPCKARVVESTDTGNAWVEVTLTHGKDRIVRKMFEAVGHPVNKLRRESYATLGLRGLARGEGRALTRAEIDRVREIAEGEDPRNAGKKTRYKKGYARPKKTASRGKRKTTSRA